MSLVEPHASSIPERMGALREAHRRELRTYGMLCPLLPGIATSKEEIDELVEFVLACGAEEVFVEPVNARGPGLKRTEAVLREGGYTVEADAVGAIRRAKNWSAYTTRLVRAIQDSLRHRQAIHKLRFLLYPSRLTPADRQSILARPEGVRFLG